VNRLDQETAKRRGPTRAVEPFKKKKKVIPVQAVEALRVAVG
jgi:hypothetical protein